MGFTLDPNIKCPISVAYVGEHKSYAASVSGPTNALRGDILTLVYKDDGVSIRGGVYTYFSDWGYNYSSAYLSFEYAAGYPTSQEAFRSDYAENSAPMKVGPNANAEVVLNYRLVTNASISGPSSPRVGSTATWTATVTNAPEPYSFRWFKNDVELPGETSASLTLPVTSTFFYLKLIAGGGDGTADTLLIPVIPEWNITLFGMTEVRPGIHCGYDSYIGNNASSPFIYQWDLDGVTLPDDGPLVDPDLSIGTHTLELFVTDANGFTGKTSLNIHVTSDGPSNCT